MRVVGGAREWLVCWAETDERGKPYPPLWVKTKHVRKPLIDDYLLGRVPRLVEVDARPLDTLVQRSVAQAAMMVMGKNESFGRVHEIEIGALSLRSLALHYFEGVVARYGMTPKYMHEPHGDEVTYELQIKDPSMVGDFCAFESFMPENTAVGALRYNLGRASNTDFVVVSPINMFFTDNKLQEGCVTFKVEFSTIKGNGVTGTMTPPHLGEKSKNPLKDQVYRNVLRAYVSDKLPRTHALFRNGVWV